MIYLDQAEIFDTNAVPMLEKCMSDYLGVHDTVALDHGTSALHMAILAAGVGAGDEVILPVLTFVATANAVHMAGATPVFVDVDRQTWCIDSAEIEKAITPHTRAIIPVHIYGNPCDMDTITEIATTHDLIVIEDACQALGATYNGHPVGTIGRYGAFSFNSNKAISADGGGLLTGQFLPYVRYLINQAKNPDGTHGRDGRNYRMSSLQAAHLLERMAALPDVLWRKEGIAHEYARHFRGANVEFQQPYAGAQSSYWYTPIILPKGVYIPTLQKLIKIELAPNQGLDITRRVFRPLTDSDAYKSDRPYPNARYLWEHGLCLPVSPENGGNVAQRVAGVIRGALGGCSWGTCGR